MPVVMCNYCEYLGQGDTFEEELADVEEHEKTCPEKDEEDYKSRYPSND